MARHPIARVMHNQLIPQDESPPILVGTSAWYVWLCAHETRSFAYQTASGRLTARRESRQSGWYWYGYRSLHGKLRKVYLGKAEELSQQRLDAAIVQLGAGQSLSMPRLESSDISPCSPSHMSLLKAKLMPPATPAYMVARPRLVSLLQKGAAGSLTLVCAPAGFGKTTFLCEGMAQSKLAYAWLSLDHEDNDPRRFLAYLIGSLQQAQPRLANFSPSSQVALTENITMLLNELISLLAEVMIVLDNYQVIENQAIHDALTFLLEHLPSHIHVIVASRSELRSPLARLRASGQLTEIGADALAFTHAETETLLISMMKLALQPEEVTTLEQRTQGWVAGLCLARYALQEQLDVSRFVATLAGNNRYILAYLLEEVFARQPEHIQSFLLHTALLDDFNASLCAVMICQGNAEPALAYLERTRLLLFSDETQASWYHYRTLFAEALRHHLQQTSPQLVPVLHARASQWFEAHSMIEKAIEHALAAHDNAHAVALIERVLPTVLARGDVPTVHAWLDVLPDEVVRHSPRLCISSAWLVFIISRPDTFLDWVEAAEQALQRSQETLSAQAVAELHGEIVGLRAIYSISFNDCASAIITCNQALQQVPPGNAYLRGLLLLMLGFAYARGMDVSAGARAASTASIVLQMTGHALLLPYVITCRAEIALAQGDPAQAAKLCRQVLTLATAQNVAAVFSAGIAHASLGHVFWEWNNLEAARLHLLQAWDLGLQTQAGKTLLTTASLLILVSHTQGKVQESDFWLQQVEDLGQKLGQIEILEFAATTRARLLLAEGRLENALHWMHEHHATLANPTNQHNEFNQFTQARVLIAAGRAYPDGSYTYQALALLQRLHTAAEEAGKVRSLLETLVLQALALELAGDGAGALDALRQAVSLAERGRYMRLFVGEGDPMLKLLRQLHERQRSQKAAGQSSINLTYLSNLLKTFASLSAPPLPASLEASEPLLDPLSRREHEVLRLIAAGRKNREIADELVVVTGTVKAHINVIYQKLGVSSRVQAVVRARTLGLL
ncbi:MAG TPA: LuxR C-terminal-related transcriptional regulator [Ktedonobacteraceae bacterium]|nr:LuxR C-terminal-related transcriptional regulator [Ktedonobacteraceae bacterium]